MKISNRMICSVVLILLCILFFALKLILQQDLFGLASILCFLIVLGMEVVSYRKRIQLAKKQGKQLK